MKVPTTNAADFTHNSSTLLGFKAATGASDEWEQDWQIHSINEFCDSSQDMSNNTSATNHTVVGEKPHGASVRGSRVGKGISREAEVDAFRVWDDSWLRVQGSQCAHLCLCPGSYSSVSCSLPAPSNWSTNIYLSICLSSLYYPPCSLLLWFHHSSDFPMINMLNPARSLCRCLLQTPRTCLIIFLWGRNSSWTLERRQQEPKEKIAISATVADKLFWHHLQTIWFGKSFQGLLYIVWTPLQSPWFLLARSHLEILF